jgi:hypothetical protein
MEKVTHINDLIASLPRIRMRKRRMWNVVIDGVVVQGVSSPINSKSDAEAYIANKYPGKVFELVYTGWKVTRHQ